MHGLAFFVVVACAINDKVEQVQGQLVAAFASQLLRTA